MSFWIFRKSRSGKRQVTAIDLEPMSLITIGALLLATVMSMVLVYSWEIALGAATCMLVGWVLIFAAKVSLFRRGIWTSWGPGLMSRRSARVYMMGYTLIGSGASLLLLTWGLMA